MSEELELNKCVELDACRVCGNIFPKISMSKVDNTICAKCASKLIARAQLDDGSWYDEGLSLGIKPWEQFHNEPRSAYTAFRAYIEAYPKELSIKELSSNTGFGETAVRHWMKRWKWKDRFFEWARECDRQLIMEQHDIRKDMNDRQIKVSQSLLEKAINRIARIDMDELGPKEVIQWAELAAKLERTATEDNRKVAETLVESRTYSAGAEKKAEAGTDNKGLQEILNILAQSGAINIESTTKITTPQVVDATDDYVDAEVVEDSDEQEV